MVEVEVGPEGWGREVILLSAFFFEKNCMISSTNTDWMYGVFDTLTGLF